MQLTKGEIVKQVRLRLDEIRLNESDFDSGADDTDLEELTVGLAVEAVKFVNSRAHIGMLEPDVMISISGNEVVGTTEDECSYNRDAKAVPNTLVGVVEIPSNFTRFVRASNTRWALSVVDALQEYDTEWPKLFNQYLTGCDEDPKVGIKHNANNTYSVLLFPVHEENTGANVDNIEVCYMKEPAFSKQGELRISRLLEEAFYYYLSSLVLSTMGDNRSDTALTRALALMGVETGQTKQE